MARVIVRSASQARKEFFDLLAAAMYKGQTTVITKSSKVAAKIVPCEEKLFDWEKYKKELKKIDKVLEKYDWNDLKKIRKNFELRKYPEW